MRFDAGMAYRVELTDRAARDLATLFEEKNASDSISAARWFKGLDRAIGSLESLPRRNALAPESKKVKRPLRHLLYGGKPHVYRIIYQIEEGSRLVRVLTIRRGAREPAADLE
jgi:toxin ParE1/3/4